MKYKVLITTSGTGSRLGEVTEYTNKALVKVGKKPAISYIIEAYSKKTDFVITVGYFGNQVRDFLKLAYPDRNFTFVEVDKFEGKGSSLGYSMLQAKKFLQCPFIFNAADTIVSNQNIPIPDKNWIGGYKGDGSSQYTSFDLIDGKISEIHDKGIMDPDFLHIGLIGLKDYKLFWNALSYKYKLNPNDSTLSDVSVLNVLMKKGIKFEVEDFKEWHDIGNVESLQKARLEIKDSFRILDKVNESISIFDKFVIKFFFDEKMVRDRVTRAKVLKGLVPEIEENRGNFYRYKYVDGHLYSKVATPYNFKFFLDWAKRKLWRNNIEISQDKFKKVCYDFYYKKSIERIGKFLSSHSIEDQANVINGETVPSIKEMLETIDFDWLCDSKQSNFHGDFILDNIIQTKRGFCLLDWRQNFGGLLKAGDMYYDLAKLNHNLTVNHEIINKNLFTINIRKDTVECDILRKENLVQCQENLFEFIKKEDYDAKKVRILTALIWLNMSPLHHHPFDLFLFYFGKLNLWKELKK